MASCDVVGSLQLLHGAHQEEDICHEEDCRHKHNVVSLLEKLSLQMSQVT